MDIPSTYSPFATENARCRDEVDKWIEHLNECGVHDDTVAAGLAVDVVMTIWRATNDPDPGVTLNLVGGESE